MFNVFVYIKKKKWILLQICNSDNNYSLHFNSAIIQIFQRSDAFN